MQLRASAIVCSVRANGETGAVALVLTRGAGMIAGYVAGARGRVLRPVLIPGNLIEIEARSKSDSQLPFLRAELLTSRGPWLGEPLAAAAIGWVTALVAAPWPSANHSRCFTMPCRACSMRCAMRLPRAAGCRG